jgi:hypothetical protein
MGKIYKTEQMNDPHWTTSSHNERRRPNKRDFLSFLFLGKGFGICFMVFSSAITTRSCAKCSFCRAFSTQHTLCLFSVGACVMPAYALHKSIDNPPMVVKDCPPPHQKKWGKNKLFENVRSQIGRYGIGVTIAYSPHKRGKRKELSNEMSELLFDFVTLVQSKPNRGTVSNIISNSTLFRPVG